MRLIQCRRPHYRGQQVHGEKGTSYHVAPDGLLHRMTGKSVADSPGVDDLDAAHFLEGDPSTFAEVEAETEKVAQVAPPLPPPRPRAPTPPPPPQKAPPAASKPPPPPAPAALPTAPPVPVGGPKGVPWGHDPAVPLEVDPGTYVSRLPPEELGHNALTVARWLELAEASGIDLTSEEARSAKAELAGIIRTRAVEWDRLRTT